jgi:hypothetical protein
MATFFMTGNAFSELEHAQTVGMGAEAEKLFSFDPAVTSPAARIFAGLPSLKSWERSSINFSRVGGGSNWTVSGAHLQR